MAKAPDPTPLIATPQTHPRGDETKLGLPAARPAGRWTGWHSVGAMLEAGHVPVPVASGAYVFRIRPSLNLVPERVPTRLISIGGMGETGTLYGRVCTYIGAGLGHNTNWFSRGPPHSGGLKFAWHRADRTSPWGITVKDLDVAFVVAPDGFKDYCAEVALWTWYWGTFRHKIGTEWYPACSAAARWTCSCGRRDHAWFKPPPAP